MNQVLSKVIIGRFYQVNLAFFLLVFLLLFGIINGKDAMMLHYAIMKSMMDSFAILGGAAAIWALYNVKCVSFFLKEIDRPENSFLFHLQAFGNRRQFFLLLQCQLAIYLPVLVYGGIASFVGFTDGHFLAAAAFIVFQLLMCCMGAGIYLARINSTWKTPAITLPTFVLFRKKSLISYLLHYSWNQRKGTFIAIKLFSLLLLQIMVAANSNKESREAVCVLIMFLISGHAMLPIYYVGFMEQQLAFLRNTSTTILRRFSIYAFSYSIIFIPELLFLLWNERGAVSLQELFSLYALAVSQLSLYTSILYFKNLLTERYTTIVFAIFFLTLLLLASFSLWFVFAAESVIALVLFYVLYWRFEMAVEKNE